MAQKSSSGPHLIRLPTGLPVGDVNVYLFTGGIGPVLVDTGPDTPAARRALDLGLAAHGVGARELAAIWLTHPHVDHIGQVARLAAESGASVFGSPETERWLFDWAGAWARRRAGTAEFAALAGAPEVITVSIADSFAALERMGKSHPHVRTIEDGDAVGGFSVLRVDGHARGHLAFLRDDVVLTGDYLLERISSNAIVEPPDAPGGPWPSMLSVQMDSLAKALSWTGRVGLGGHGEPVTDPAAAAGRHMADAKRRQRAYLADLCRPLTLWQATQARFPSVRGEEVFLALSETAGHLFRLRDLDLVEVEVKDGTWTFEARPAVS